MALAPLGRSCRNGSKQVYRRRVKQLLATVCLVMGMALLVSCGNGGGTAATPSTNTLRVTASSTLSPAFDPNISDYVIPYKAGSPVQVTVNAPQSTQVSVDGQPSRSLDFTAQVSVTPGQSFPVVVTAAGSSKTYFVRCLPAGFPAWTTERPGTPQSDYYVFAPALYLTPTAPAADRYVIVADNQGVPLWWYRTDDVPYDAKLLPNGNIAWTLATSTEERTLDGTLVRGFNAANLPGRIVNDHELLLLPNGNYLLITDVSRGPVDLTPYGGSASATVIDNVIEEVTPGGASVWRWSAMDHLPVSETDPHWWYLFLVNASPADPYHANSVEPTDDGYIVSLRHLNAVVRIDRATGNIVWKLGGSARPESLTFAGDAYGNFGGQHDARLLPDGTLTVHDNGSVLGRPPRTTRYSLDLAAKTATLIEQVTDADVSGSVCCGNSTKLPGGNWDINWGGNLYITELTATGKRVFRLTFAGPLFPYRVAPIAPGVLSRDTLRKAMDARFPR